MASIVAGLSAGKTILSTAGSSRDRPVESLAFMSSPHGRHARSNSKSIGCSASFVHVLRVSSFFKFCHVTLSRAVPCRVITRRVKKAAVELRACLLNRSASPTRKRHQRRRLHAWASRCNRRRGLAEAVLLKTHASRPFPSCCAVLCEIWLNARRPTLEITSQTPA